MIKLIAFDWNGTLLADTAITWRADNAVLIKLKQKPISLTNFKQTFDIPILKYWRNVGLSESFLKQHLEKLEKNFQKIYQSTEDAARLRVHARQTLKWLRDKKISPIAYSNAPSSHIHKHLLRLRVENAFDAILGREDADITHLTARGKQQRLGYYVKSKKLKPREIISVGDTEEEIEIGKQCGYHTVAITGGYNTTSRLKKHNPDFLIHNMKDLIGIIKKLNKV